MDPIRATFERLKRQEWAHKDWAVSSPSKRNRETLGTTYESFSYLLPQTPFYEREPEVDLSVTVADYACFAEVSKVILNYFQRSNNDVKKNVDKFRKPWQRYKYGLSHENFQYPLSKMRQVEASITGGKNNKSTRKAKESLKRGSQVVYR